MRAQFLRTCLRGGCAGVLALGIFTSRHAFAGAYLADVGPTPLRYQTPKSPAKIIRLPPLATEEEPVSTNAAVSVSVPASAPPASPAPAVRLVSSSPGPRIVPPPTAATNVSNATETAGPATAANEQPADSQPDASSANDLLGITPQMVVEYFKPAQSPTNAPGASVYVPVGFTPPAPASAPSKAAYNSQ